MNRSKPNPLQRFTMPEGWETIWSKTMYAHRREWLESVMPLAEIVRITLKRDGLTVYWRHRE